DVDPAFIVDISVRSQADAAVGVVALGHDEPVPRAWRDGARRCDAPHQSLRLVGVRRDRSNGTQLTNLDRTLERRLAVHAGLDPDLGPVRITRLHDLLFPDELHGVLEREAVVFGLNG